MKARFAHWSSDTVMIVTGVGNTSGNTNTRNSNNRRDGEPDAMQGNDFGLSYARQERPFHLEVEAEVLAQSTNNSPKPKANVSRLMGFRTLGRREDGWWSWESWPKMCSAKLATSLFLLRTSLDSMATD